MKKVQRQEILDYVTYSEQRKDLQQKVFKLKEPRRIHVGEYLTFLFENTDTARYQIQEILRVEKIVKESDINHEIETYNQLLGTESELSCVLLIEIDSAAEREVKLKEWRNLPKHLYMKLPDGKKIRPTYDTKQADEIRLSAVQYLRFNTGGIVPEAIGSDLKGLSVEVNLTPEQKKALAEDLK